MTRKQWNARGYAVLFRHGTVYLVHLLSRGVIQAPVSGCAWIDADNVNGPPWTIEPQGLEGLSLALAEDFRRTVRACYCGQCGVDLCDFCAGRREAPAPDPQEAP